MKARIISRTNGFYWPLRWVSDGGRMMTTLVGPYPTIDAVLRVILKPT